MISTQAYFQPTRLGFSWLLSSRFEEILATLPKIAWPLEALAASPLASITEEVSGLGIRAALSVSHLTLLDKSFCNKHGAKSKARGAFALCPLLFALCPGITELFTTQR
jgi:hypothetical protein